MANLSIKDFDAELYFDLKVASLDARLTLRNYITAALQHAIETKYNPNAQEPKKGPARAG